MSRIDKIVEYINHLGVDSLLLTSEENCHYVCGFSPSESKILISKNGTALQLVDSRYTVVAKRYSLTNSLKVLEVNSYGYTEIIEFIKDENIKTLGFESDKITFTQHSKLSEKIQADLCPVTECLMELRNSKTPEELENMLTAQRIAEKAYQEILNIISVGKTEKELANELNYLMRKFGSHGKSFDTIFISGINTSMPHGVPSDKQIESGDFITMDFGATFNGYHSDMTRTVAVDFASDEMICVYDTVLKAQLAAIENIGVNKCCKDVYFTAYDIIKNAGYGDYFKHALGHGVGLEIHEGYSTSPNIDKKYNAGYVTSVEPGIYLPEKFGVRIEDVIYIGEKSNYNLMNVSKDLIIL